MRKRPYRGFTSEELRKMRTSAANTAIKDMEGYYYSLLERDREIVNQIDDELGRRK